jgi:SpoVK/Ycf46/Vps4 family AAA+-type ATPase
VAQAPGRRPAADVDHLAARFAVSPAQIESAARSARMLGPDGDARRLLEGIIAPVAALVDARKQPPPRLPAGGYDPRLAESRVDLHALADRLAGFRETEGPGVSLCLYGPPGTGKSEYVRYLAARLDRPLIVRRCSDLLSMWVGGTEKQLAEAFREAREERAVLLLDEADSFLRDRRRVTQGWEVTQVNELLQQLEAFEGIVACTTNLFDDLDKAALRRFTFRIAFGALPPPKARALFVRLLDELAVDAGADDRQAAEAALGRLVALTPGDFAVVARRLRALRPASGLDARSVVRELEEEVAVKDGAARRAGFAGGV